MEDPDPYRADAAYDAVLFDRGEALPDLEELYKTRGDNDNLRFLAIQLMGFSEDKRAIPLVVNAMQDPSPRVRAEACRALEDLRARNAVDHLLARVEDLDASVRRAARETLAAFGLRRR